MRLVRVYDTVHTSVSLLPKDGYAYAGYVGHGLASIIWTPADWASLPPNAHHLTITAFADTDADILDYEPGNTHDIPSAVSWHQRQIARGGLGVIYSDLSDHPALLNAIPDLKWWAANPTDNAVLYPGSVATQYKWTPEFDISLFDADVFWPVYPSKPSTRGPRSVSIGANTWQ